MSCAGKGLPWLLTWNEDWGWGGVGWGSASRLLDAEQKATCRVLPVAGCEKARAGKGGLYYFPQLSPPLEG